ncbi:MAG: efflux RND transporter periplasmic adaptor subunit [Anaerohalosphaeraceae bacterium]
MTKRTQFWNIITSKAGFLILLIGVFAAGWFTKVVLTPQGTQTPSPEVQPNEAIWTCSMHPQIRQPQPGKCPICGMDLIPVRGSDSQASGVMEFTPEAAKLMEIQTSKVERKSVATDIRLIGKIDYDQTRIKSITAWTGGRIDRLFVDYTGMTVRKGDHMVELYSPELISAQTELLEAVKSVQNIASNSSDLIRRSIEGTLKASEEKLRLLGITDEQIQQIKASGQILDHLTINAPIGGVVIDKMANEGMYVDTGMAIYSIADLSKLWLILDAYESDLKWLRFGQKVEFATESIPGRTFEATVSFLSPVLNEMTRTVKIRAVVDNTNGVLKPGMFIRAKIHSPMAADGNVIDPSLMGKYICPMHGEIIRDISGVCDICGMKLVAAQDLGYQTAGEPNQLPLVIPATAPLITGRKLNKAVVYVKVAGEHPSFIGKEIVLGPKAGDFYIVESGLMEGEEVVTNGAFKIDSAAQIQAMPSMMTLPLETEASSTEQTLCPVMGGAIDKSVFTEYKGKKVYFCCPSCIEEFNKDPEKYVPQLPQFKTTEHSH